MHSFHMASDANVELRNRNNSVKKKMWSFIVTCSTDMHNTNSLLSHGKCADLYKILINLGRNNNDLLGSAGLGFFDHRLLSLQ